MKLDFLGSRTMRRLIALVLSVAVLLPLLFTASVPQANAAENESCSVELKWNSDAEAVINGDSLVWNPNNMTARTFSLQVRFSNHTGEEYAPGEIVMELPYRIFDYRDASISSGHTSTTGARYQTISLATSNPSEDVPFVYKTDYENNKIIVTNELTVPGATNVTFHISYSINPLYTVDGTKADIALTVQYGEKHTKSNTLDLTVNTWFEVTAEKTALEQMYEWPSGLDGKPDDFSDYYYYWYQITFSSTGSQAVQYILEENPQNGGELVGFFSSYTGNSPTRYDKEENPNICTVNSYWPDSSGNRSPAARRYYTLVRFPKANGTELENAVNVYAVGIDDGLKSTQASVKAVAQDFHFEYEGHLYKITKTGAMESEPVRYYAYKLMEQGYEPIQKWTIESTSRAYKGEEGYSYTTEIVDDIMYLEPQSSKQIPLTTDDYYYKSVVVQMYDYEMNMNTGKLVEREASTLKPAKLYAKVKGSDTWQLVKEVEWSKYSNWMYEKVTLPENTVQIKVSYSGGIYETQMKLQVEMAIRADSPRIHEMMNASNPTSFGIRNFASLLVYDDETGKLLNPTDESNYVAFSSEYKEAVMNSDRETYGSLVQRGAALQTIYNYSASSGFTKRTQGTVNQPGQENVRVTYRLTASEGFNAYSIENLTGGPLQILKDGGYFEERREATFYDLLPLGVSYQSATAYKYNGSSVGVESDVELIHNYKGSGRTMVIVNVRYVGDDENMGVTYNTPISSTSWLCTGFQVSIVTVVPWENVPELGTGTNHSAYQVDTNMHGTAYADNGSGAPSAVRELFYNLADKDEVDTTLKNTRYASSTTSINVFINSVNGLTKRVRYEKDDPAIYSRETTVDAGGSYLYRMTVGLGDDGTLSDVVVFDRLENAANEGEDAWRGTFDYVDLNYAQSQGISPVVYYSTNENAAYDLSDAASGWTVLEPADKSSIRAIAVDLSKKTGGSDFIFQPNSAVSVLVYMTAPEETEATYAYNKAAYYSVFSSGTESFDSVNECSRTTVSLVEEIPEEIIVDYVWVSEDNPTDVAPPDSDTIGRGTTYISKSQDTTEQERYVFAGWYTDESCKTRYTDNTVLYEDTTLYGYWSRMIYLDYEWVSTDNPTDVTPPYQQSLYVGDNAYAQYQQNSKQGYVFDGWYHDKELTEPFESPTQLFEDKTIYGKWTRQIVVDYEWVGEDKPGDVMPPDSDTINKGTAYDSKPQDETEERYVFDGWYLDEELKTPYEDGTVLEDDTTLYGKWTPLIVVDYQWVGEHRPSDVTPPTEDIIKKGTAYDSKPQENTEEAYYFDGWYLDADLKIPYEDGTILETDTTLYGKWNPLLDPIDPEKSVSESSEAGIGGAEVKAGDEIEYQIDFFNHLPEKATVIITDQLDENVKFVNASDEASYDEKTHTVMWILKDFDAESKGSVFVTVEVLESAIEIVENKALVKIGNEDAVWTNNVENPIEPDEPEQPEKAVAEDSESGIDGEAVKPGANIKYEIKFYNHFSKASVVTITDKLDDTVKFVDAGNDGVYDAETHTVKWILNAVSAKSHGSVTLTVEVLDSAVEVVKNKALVQIGENDAEWTNEVETPIVPEEPKEPEKAVAEDSASGIDGAAVKPGNEIKYAIRFFNHKYYAATVKITDKLDDNVKFVSASNDGTYDAETHTVTWTLDAFPAESDGSVFVTVEVLDTAVEVVKNKASVKISNEDDVETNEVTNPIEPEVPVDPEKAVAEDSAAGINGAAVKPGNEIKYEISFFNHKYYAATVKITDKLDDNVKFVSASNDGTYDAETHTVIWTLDAFPAESDGSVFITVEVLDTAVEVVKNKASVKISNEDDVETNEVTNPIEPEVPVDPEKAVSEDSTAGIDGAAVKAGDEINYVISFYNHKYSAATVTITDKLDATVKFVSASDGGVYDAETHTVTWTLDAFPAESNGAVTVTVAVLDSAEEFVRNEAGVQIGNEDEVKTNEVENPVAPEEPQEPTTEPVTEIPTTSGNNGNGGSKTPFTGDAAIVIVLAVVSVLAILFVALSIKRRNAKI